MLLILIGIVVAGIAGLLLLTATENFLSGFFGIVILSGTGMAGITYAFSGWSWLASEYKTKIINREYGAAYTREEIFWASDVIDPVRELDRKRVELNGGLMRKSDEQ